MSKNPLRLDALEKDPKIREAILIRLQKAAKDKPIVILHQIIQMLETYKE